MIISMKPGATREQVDRVCSRIQEMDFAVKIMLLAWRIRSSSWKSSRAWLRVLLMADWLKLRMRPAWLRLRSCKIMLSVRRRFKLSFVWFMRLA